MNQPTFAPVHDFPAALAQVQALQRQDDDSIHPDSGTKLWSHGDKTPRAVLYLHGYTDSTRQFDPFGDILFQQGFNVFAPRLPYHGYKDRLSCAHCELTADEMVEWTSSVTDLAVGLGSSLVVLGLSLGGVLATWVAEQRADVERVLILSPAYGTRLLPAPMTSPTARVLRRLPNFFLWWDPRVREQAGFEYTYPRFATHTLAQAYLLSGDLLEHARNRPPAARAVWMITNANDYAVSPALCKTFVNAWRAHASGQVHTYEFPRVHRIPHDLMDPNDPGVKPDIVYPKLLDLIKQPLDSLTGSQTHKGARNEQVPTQPR
jgi:pimeloyl-ACP methyl ester carboxylesterase